VKAATGALLFALLLSLVPAPAKGGGTYEGDPDEPGPPGPGSALVVFGKDHPLGEAKPDKALVYVVRPTGFGGAVRSFFFCDDEPHGINQGSSYFFAAIAPGTRAFWSDAESPEMLRLNVEAGQVYYIQQHVDLDALHARTRLELLDDMTGPQALAQCRRHGILTDSGRARGRAIVRRHRAFETPAGS
jgi:hypothetical protein